jgi:glycosyltransferase involved in cell wall biosynthesis
LLDEYKSKGFFRNSKTGVVPNPVIMGSERLSNNRDRFRFLYLGQLEPYKGVRELLSAWKTFSAEHKDVELIIAGKGSLENDIEQQVKQLSRVEFIGWVEHGKLGELFSKVSATIVPSLAYENSPTIIGESFSYGVPVIASRIGGIPELLNDGVNGLLFKPGDIKELVQAMHEIMKVDLSRGAQSSAAQFSLEKYKREILKVE